MKNYSCLLLFLSFVAAFAQEKKSIAVKIDSIPMMADSFVGNDIYGSYYFIQDNIFLKKHKEKNWQYKNPTLGKITKIDVENPLKIVLFYENFNTVILLDNQLNETQKIKLSENAVPIVATAVGLAFGNRLWIYNSLSQQIGLLDYLKNDYQPITTPFKGNMAYYDSDFNYFNWIDEKSFWHRCDVYGKITTVAKVPDSGQFQFVNDSIIIYEKDNKLYYFDSKTNKSTLINFDKKTFESFSFKDQILSIFTNQGITNYKISLP